MKGPIGGSVIIFLLAALCSSGVLAMNCPDFVFLNKVTPRDQDTGSWCWAASQQMVMESYGSEYFDYQCNIATAVLRSTVGLPNSIRSCCDPQSIYLPACATVGWPDFPLYHFNATKVEVRDPSDPLGSDRQTGWDALREQLCNGQGFVITLERGRTAHQYVVNGFKVIFVTDPITGTFYEVRTVYAFDPNGPDLKVWPIENYKYDDDLKAYHSSDFIDAFPLR